MRWVLVLFLAAAAPAAAQPPAPAAAPQAPAAPSLPGTATYLGKPVEQVQLTVDGQPTQDASLSDLLETRVGRPQAMEDVRESIAHLYSLGRFQDVQVDATLSASGGVVLRYDLFQLQSVQDIEFAGTLGLSKGLLRSTVSDRYGATPPLARAADAVRTLEALYRDNGYLSASIKAETQTRQGRTILVFNIESGTQARISEVAIEGDPKVSHDAFLHQLQAAKGTPFQEQVIQRRLDDFVTRLRKRGYFEAVGNQRATVSEDRTSVNLSLTIQPGPFITVRFEGDPLPAEKQKELVPIEREASASEDLLEDSIVAIRAYLHQQGYWKGDASWRREEGQGTAALIFDVRKGRKYFVAEPVVMIGHQAASTEELRALIALKPGDVFLESALSIGSAAITELYRQRGFTAAVVKYAVSEADPRRQDEGVVRPSVTITEGPQTIVGTVSLTGNTALSELELRPLIKLAEGAPFYQPRALADRDALTVEYLNNGFASADINVTTDFSPDHTRVDVHFVVQEGPQTIVDHILIVGNTHTDPRIILNEMKLKPGQPLGLEDQVESQRAIGALGLFRRVRITALRHGSDAREDVLVTVEEAPMTTIAYGGGLEAAQRLRATGPEGEAQEHLEFAPRGFFNIGRRNVGGRNRTIDLFTRASLRPQDAPDDPTKDGTGIGLSEYRVVGTFRQPRSIWQGDLVVTGGIEQGVRSSFNFTRKGVNADLLRRLNRAYRVDVRYSFNTTRTFDERLDPEDQATIDRLFPQVRLSEFTGALSRDTRDDVVEPRRGSFMSADGNIAARALGGQVGFMKTYLQGSWFRQIASKRAVVFASRVALGLANGFPREAQPTDESGNPIPGPPVIVDDLPASERFFAGGDSTIRGFALDTVGAPNTISPEGFPRGGNAVLILNGELRVPVWREFGTAIFADGGNVFERPSQFDFGELRGALGVGLRYKSPVGPIRLDVGFKLDRREIGGQLEPRAVWHFSIGQAF